MSLGCDSLASNLPLETAAVMLNKDEGGMEPLTPLEGKCGGSPLTLQSGHA